MFKLSWEKIIVGEKIKELSNGRKDKKWGKENDDDEEMEMEMEPI